MCFVFYLGDYHLRRIIIIGLSVCVFLILFPFAMNFIYHLNPPLDFFKVDFDNKDLLAYYGSAFGFLGTMILSTITIIQNKKAQEKTDEVNELMLKLQEKSMEIAEKQFVPSTGIGIPKFEVILRGHHGNYRNPYFLLRNVASGIISNLSFISFCAKNSDGVVIEKAKNSKFNYTSLASSEMCEIEVQFEGLKKIEGEFILLVFSFSCEDEKGSIHYFKSEKKINSLNSLSREVWNTKTVG